MGAEGREETYKLSITTGMLPPLMKQRLNQPKQCSSLYTSSADMNYCQINYPSKVIKKNKSAWTFYKYLTNAVL